MSTPFPTISHSRVALYPLTRTRTYATTVQQFLGDGEVRWVSQLPVSKLLLIYTDVPTADIATLETFFNSQGGASTSEITFTLPSNGGGSGTIAYSHLLLDSDTFSKTQTKPNMWTVQIPLRQTRV